MNARLAILLTLSLTATGFCAAAQPDPNSAAANPKFISGDPHEWGVLAPGADGKLRVYFDPGSIKPTYVAELYLPRDRMYVNDREVLNLLMKSPLAQKLSKAQKDFLAEGWGIWVDLETEQHPNYYIVWFYAVSEQDAKTMALAFLDFLASEAKRITADTRNQLDKAKETLQQNQATLPQKKQQLESVAAQYTKLKNATYPSLSDDEVKQTTKEILLQMDKEARILEIDLAGVRGKLKVIDKYIADNYHIAEGAQDPMRLTTWKTEQMIELSGLDARQQAIEKIRVIPQSLETLSRERGDLQRAVNDLTKAIEQDTRDIEWTTKALEHPTPSSFLLPPKIYGNTVVIHPVLLQSRSKPAQ